MNFTYASYRGLLSLLREEGYAVRGYHDYGDAPRCVIFRHDIDICLDQAVKLAELEAEEGVSATYFVLLRTDLYNAFSKAGKEALDRIRSLGHEIGLHFDEASYVPALDPDGVVQNIIKECGLLSALLETRVSSVSMHRPSEMTLEADYRIPGIVNSYGKTFFREFKYLSDSRRRWREPVEDIIRSGEFDQLHILTHAFWYHNEESCFETDIFNFINRADGDRYRAFSENIKNMPALDELRMQGGCHAT